jgi:hypothetical protein
MKRRRRGEEELEKERKDAHFEEQEAHKERAHLLGDEGTLVLEVEGALEGRRFAEEEGCIVQGQKGALLLGERAHLVQRKRSHFKELQALVSWQIGQLTRAKFFLIYKQKYN